MVSIANTSIFILLWDSDVPTVRWVICKSLETKVQVGVNWFSVVPVIVNKAAPRAGKPWVELPSFWKRSVVSRVPKFRNKQIARLFSKLHSVLALEVSLHVIAQATCCTAGPPGNESHLNPLSDSVWALCLRQRMLFTRKKVKVQAFSGDFRPAIACRPL